MGRDTAAMCRVSYLFTDAVFFQLKLFLNSRLLGHVLYGFRRSQEPQRQLYLVVQFCAAVSNTTCAVIRSSHLSRCHITQ